MTVIDIQNIKVSQGSRDLLKLKNLQVQDNQRIGLVGKNGSGKTTLFNVLIKNEEPDIGDFRINGRVAMLPQLKKTDTTKSGGEVSQEYIIQTLSKSSKVLLADEPSTNLDTSHVDWVERQLNSYPGAIILVSHDRKLLDNVCDTIWELTDGEITEYTGNYSDYIKQKENEKKQQQKEYQKYQQKKHKLEQAISHKENQATRALKVPKNLSSSERRDASGVNPYFQKLQKGLHQNRKALETRLDKLEVVEQPKEESSIQMDLPNQRAFKNKMIIKAEKLKGEVAKKTLWNPTTFFINGGEKIGIIGPNGSGKTTFLKKIINQSDDNLYSSPAMKIGYFSQNLDLLNKDQTILQNVSNESSQNETLIRIVLARLGFYRADVHKKVHVLSGGERVKVSLAKLFVGDYNTLILDEPTNYLDVYALEALEDLLIEYEGSILFVSHDRKFIQAIATKILYIEEEEMKLFHGDYDAYLKREHQEIRDTTAEALTKIELNITNVMTKLGDPLLSDGEKEELEVEFQTLIKQKRKITE